MGEFKVGYIYKLFYEAYSEMYEWVDGIIINNGALDDDSMRYLEYITLTRYGRHEITLDELYDMELKDHERDELTVIQLMREVTRERVGRGNDLQFYFD